MMEKVDQEISADVIESGQLDAISTGVSAVISKISPLFEDVLALFGDAIGELPDDKRKEYLGQLNGIATRHGLDVEFVMDETDNEENQSLLQE